MKDKFETERGGKGFVQFGVELFVVFCIVCLFILCIVNGRDVQLSGEFANKFY